MARSLSPLCLCATAECIVKTDNDPMFFEIKEACAQIEPSLFCEESAQDAIKETKTTMKVSACLPAQKFRMRQWVHLLDRTSGDKYQLFLKLL